MSGLPEAQTVPRRSGGRRAVIALCVGVAILALLGFALWLADGLIRSIAQDGVAEALESKLPESVKADVTVNIGGALFVPQVIAGEFDEVTLTTRDAEASGIRFDLVAVAHGVPLDENGTIEEVTATVTGGEDAANELLVLGGADPRLSLGDGTLSYDQTANFFGTSIGYTLVAEPKAHGDSVTLAPVDVAVTSDFGELDLTALVTRLLGDEPVSVCVASSLPDGISVDDIDVTPQELTLSLAASDVPRNGPDLDSRGSCDAE